MVAVQQPTSNRKYIVCGASFRIRATGRRNVLGTFMMLTPGDIHGADNKLSRMIGKGVFRNRKTLILPREAFEDVGNGGEKGA